MTDLTKIINQNYITETIDLEYERRNIKRSYLGLSECGHECKRYLWYVFNQKTVPGLDKAVPEGRILRLFQLGNILEEQTRADFMAAGFAMCSDQKEVRFDYQGTTLKGHIDGVMTGLKESDQPHLWEFKTCNQAGFNKLLKLNSYEAWEKKYKFQIHAYALGLKLDRILVTVYNKNTSELYQERIRLDKDWIIKQLQEVFSSITLSDPPERLCPRADWWVAKFCPYQKVCWNLK